MTDIAIRHDWTATNTGFDRSNRLLSRLRAVPRLIRLRRYGAQMDAENPEFTPPRGSHIDRWIDLYLPTHF